MPCPTASRGGGPPFPNLVADGVPGLWKAELPASSRAALRTLGFTARYSQGSAFLDVVNLPSSCRSNCHTCIKLLKKFWPVPLFPFHRVNIPTGPGLAAQMVQEEKSTTTHCRAFPGATARRRFMVHNAKVSVSNKAEPRVTKAPFTS